MQTKNHRNVIVASLVILAALFSLAVFLIGKVPIEDIQLPRNAAGELVTFEQYCAEKGATCSVMASSTEETREIRYPWFTIGIGGGSYLTVGWSAIVTLTSENIRPTVWSMPTLQLVSHDTAKI